MSPEALVSILVPVYNRVDLIEATVQSAREQTWSNIEIVVVDNASTDGTWDTLQKLAAQDPRVRIFRNDTNLGPVRNWMRCVDHAQGEFGKILWSDDLIDTSFVTACMAYLAAPDVGFVYTAARIFSDTPDQDESSLQYATLGAGVHSSDAYIRGTILGDELPLSPGCAMFRMKDLRGNLKLAIPNSVGSDFSKHAIGNDYLLYLLTARQYANFAVISKPLSLFRDHAGSISSSSGFVRLQTHYNMVRAYFAQKFGDEKLRRQLNTRLRLHLWLHDCSQWKINKVDDFYPEAIRVKYGLAYLARWLFVQAARRLKPGAA